MIGRSHSRTHSYIVGIDQRTTRSRDQHLRKADGSRRVDGNDVLQQVEPVGLIASLLRVRDDLVVLLRLGEARNDLVLDLGTVVELERQADIERACKISKFLAGRKLPTKIQQITGQFPRE